jgi:hypothetical protein
MDFDEFCHECASFLVAVQTRLLPILESAARDANFWRSLEYRECFTVALLAPKVSGHLCCLSERSSIEIQLSQNPKSPYCGFTVQQGLFAVERRTLLSAAPAIFGLVIVVHEQPVSHRKSPFFLYTAALQRTDLPAQ